MDPNNIKALIPGTCPHCKADIMLHLATSIPSVLGIISPDDISAAKKVFLERLSEIPLPDGTVDTYRKWASDPEVAFTISDVDEMIVNIIKENHVDPEEA